MNRDELVTALRSMPHTQIRHVHHEIFRAAADMLEVDAAYRAVSHEATTCREVARQQTDTVNRLSVECDQLTNDSDALRALIREVKETADSRLSWGSFTPDLWARLTEAGR